MPNTGPLNINGVPPVKQFDVHIWVDFVELLCLISGDKSISRGDILDRVRTPDIDGGIDDPDDASEDIDSDDALEGTGRNEENDFPAALNDKWSKRADDWFQHLRYRSSAFASNYPFSISHPYDTLLLKQEITPTQKLYIFLLLCANLRYCESSSSILTTTFEQLSAEVIRSFFSGKAEVHVFGKNTGKMKDFSGTLYKKICLLAKNLGEEVRIKKAQLPPNDNGDGGLDIVAWVSTGDELSHRIYILGQCACTEKWKSKQFSSSPEQWRQYISIHTGISNVIFIPFCLRDADGGWHQKGDIASVMVDRQRFLHFLEDKNLLADNTPASKVLQKAIGQREDIF